MLYDWFTANIYNGSVRFDVGDFYLVFYPGHFFALLMFCLFLWAAFHLTTDVIMAFRSMFGLGNKKKKGGS